MFWRVFYACVPFRRPNTILSTFSSGTILRKYPFRSGNCSITLISSFFSSSTSSFCLNDELILGPFISKLTAFLNQAFLVSYVDDVTDLLPYSSNKSSPNESSYSLSIMIWIVCCTSTILFLNLAGHSLVISKYESLSHKFKS